MIVINVDYGKTCCNAAELITLFDDEGHYEHWRMLRCKRCGTEWIGLVLRQFCHSPVPDDWPEGDFRFPYKILPAVMAMTPVNNDEREYARKFDVKRVEGENRTWVIWKRDGDVEVMKEKLKGLGKDINVAAKSLLRKERRGVRESRRIFR